MGNDGSSTSKVARDAFGFGLHYFGLTDYEPINTNTTLVKPFANAGSADAGFKPLYNGNIAAMSVNIPKAGEALLYTYTYDQLNRLTRMNTYNNLNAATNSWGWPAAVSLNFREQMSYDANGNILRYLRNGNAAQGQLVMDSLTYNYEDGTNQLTHVRDSVGANRYITDIDNQAINNYLYSPIGNLVADASQGITNISWTVYGKINTITRSNGSSVSYVYDASGNRILKKVVSASGATTVFTCYVRDASGNVISTYVVGDATVNTGQLTQTETHLYGSSRLGIYQPNKNVQNPPSTITFAMPGIGNALVLNFIRGKKFFELSNHLGNVLATVSDKKVQVSTNGSTISYYNADVLTATDYYPFGMTMPGRSFSSGSYRYGFNGKENDKDAGEGIQDYGMRVYDSRLGRFLSVDPITSKYPELTPYQFASNRPIEGIDLDGLEFISTQAEDAYWAEKGVKLKRPGTSTLIKLEEPAKSKPSPATIKPTYSDNTVVVKKQSSMAFNKPPDPVVLKADIYGTGIIDKESVVDAIVAKHRNDYYSSWGQNIAGGFFGALGSHIGGISGSNIGAAVDGVAQSFAGITKPGSSIVLSRPAYLEPSSPVKTEINIKTIKPSLSKLSFGELQNLNKANSSEMNLFFKSFGTESVSKDALKAYQELAIRILCGTGAAPARKLSEKALKVQSERLKMINEVLKAKKE